MTSRISRRLSKKLAELEVATDDHTAVEALVLFGINHPAGSESGKGDKAKKPAG